MRLSILSKRSWFIQLNKENLRAHFRAIRKQLPADYRQAAAKSAAQHFIHHPLFEKSQHIACYMAHQNEMNPQVLVDAIWQANKHCYLPMLMNDQTLQFALYEPNDELVLNQYGIPEPQANAKRMMASELDVVMMPLVAFDRQGNRLGMGGGFYDKTFAKLNRPTLLGFAYSVQEVECLPSDSWDVKLAGVVTEKEMIILS